MPRHQKAASRNLSFVLLRSPSTFRKLLFTQPADSAALALLVATWRLYSIPRPSRQRARGYVGRTRTIDYVVKAKLDNGEKEWAEQAKDARKKLKNSMKADEDTRTQVSHRRAKRLALTYCAVMLRCI